MESLLKHPNTFHKVCTEVLNEHPVDKKNYICENNKLFMNKILPQ